MKIILRLYLGEDKDEDKDDRPHKDDRPDGDTKSVDATEGQVVDNRTEAALRSYAAISRMSLRASDNVAHDIWHCSSRDKSDEFKRRALMASEDALKLLWT